MTATTEPADVTAGDTIAWQRTLDGYPASAGWALQYTLINAAAKITINGVAAGDAHGVSIPASTSAGWAAGRYTWQATVTKAAERYTVGAGVLLVRPNLAAATTADTRSAARKALDAVDAALASYGNKAYLQAFTIGDRQQQFRSPDEFMAFRSRLQAEVRREENADRLAAGLAGRNRVHIRFGASR